MGVSSKIFILPLLIASLAQGATKLTPEEEGLELQQTQEDQKLEAKARKNLKLDIGCKREFSKDGQYYRLDSFDNKDGERLRPFIQNYPEAVSQLNFYQKNKSNLTTSAVIGTIGILGIVLQNNLLNSNRIGQTGRDIVYFGSIGLVVSAILYSLITISSNETHLEKAVFIHNQQNPDSQIELKFSTGFSL